MPGASRFLDTANSLRARVDELQKRVRGVEDLERRVASLEKQVAALTKQAAKPAAKRPVRATRTSGGGSGEPGGSPDAGR
jgi:cell division septum initiation protein DivIVA